MASSERDRVDFDVASAISGSVRLVIDSSMSTKSGTRDASFFFGAAASCATVLLNELKSRDARDVYRLRKTDIESAQQDIADMLSQRFGLLHDYNKKSVASAAKDAVIALSRSVS